ncbi:uncharacterized protein LOC109406415 [Aedes albopictus]|uniref:Odorant receptor n=1 Tax=Aedes albopictus TaxID=7160 RepID=A0ABM1YZ11_AEDAL
MFAQIRYAWSRGCAWWSTGILWVHRLWFDDEASATDCFWWLDVLFLLGGIRSSSTSKWAQERLIRIIFQSLFASNIIVFYLQLVEDWNSKEDASLIIMEVTKITGISISFLRMVAAAMLIEPFTTLRRFVSGNSVNSGDAQYDECERNKFNRFARTAMTLIVMWITTDTILFAIPSSTKDELFKFPLMLSAIGETASRILNIVLVSCIPACVFPKTAGCTAYIAVLLKGMRMKLRMLAHRFERITGQSALCEDKYFDHVNWEVRHALLQHLEYWKYLDILKDLVGKVFLLVHYFSIFAIGAMFYVCREVRISFMTVIYIAGLAFSLSEYFLLCYLIDSLQDEADSLEQHIFEICALVPFRPERRSEYVQWRTTLMTIWINTRNGMSMWCSGLFEINTSQFVAVLNIAYSMLTFLLQMG